MRKRRFLRAERGGVSMVTALLGVSMIGFAGLATDVGGVYLQSRRLQGAVDLAAIAAAQDPAHARVLAQATLVANGWPQDVALDVSTGVYTADRALTPEQRYQAGVAGANAVRISAASEAPLYFGRLFISSGHIDVSRTATAAQTRWASFQIGSRLLALQGGVANSVLSGLTGSSVSLSVMDYNALAGADIDLFSYVSALRTRLDLQAATFGDTLSQRVETPTALAAIADVLDATESRGGDAIRTVAAAAAHLNSAQLSELLDLGPYKSNGDASSIGSTGFKVNALQLATAILQLANGDRQVALQLNSGAPGLANTSVWLAIGERPNASPWLSITDDSDVIVRTAQARLYTETNVGLSGALASLGSVRVPVLVELASGQAKLRDVRCGIDASDRSVTLSVSPSIGTLALGEINRNRLNDFTSPLTIAPAQLIRAGGGLVRVDGQARITLGGDHWTDAAFSGSDISNGVTRTVSTTDAAQATLSSLLGQTQLTVHVAGLGLNTAALTNATKSALTSVGAPLDSLLNSMSALLGVRLGQADVRVNGVRCGGAALVA